MATSCGASLPRGTDLAAEPHPESLDDERPASERLKELLAIPEDQRSEAVWDEIIDLETRDIPINPLRVAGGERPDPASPRSAPPVHEHAERPDPARRLPLEPMRDFERARRINGRHRKRRVVLTNRWCCRVMRKDYYIAATKMALARGETLIAIQTALQELECLLPLLRLPEAPAFDLAAIPPEHQKAFEVLVIHPLASRFLADIVRVDRLCSVMRAAAQEGGVSDKAYARMFHLSRQGVYAVKNAALQLSSSHSTDAGPAAV